MRKNAKNGVFMKLSVRITAALVALIMLLSMLSACGGEPSESGITSIEIEGAESRTMKIGDVCLLEVVQVEIATGDLVWSVHGDAVTVDRYGIVVAVKAGEATVTVRYGNIYDRVVFTVLGDEDEGEPDEEIVTDPYVGVSKEEFYASYTPAKSFVDAYYRTQHGLLSGELEVPSAAPTHAENQPMVDGMYIRNSDMRYEDNGNTYVVLDSTGNVAFKIYRGAAYITLEEVAAYMFAFGGSDGAFPANYVSDKKTSPTKSIWGEYLRVNHSYFLGDTTKYPREPELPNISGCGGTLQYWEMDIGTGSYNNGNKITRGACRIVYGRNDLDRDGVYEENELHVFYTYNHYDDFQEYLNYEGGWGAIFGYETNGSSSVKGPSPYVPVAYASFSARVAYTPVVYFYVPSKEWLYA